MQSARHGSVRRWRSARACRSSGRGRRRSGTRGSGRRTTSKPPSRRRRACRSPHDGPREGWRPAPRARHRSWWRARRSSSDNAWRRFFIWFTAGQAKKKKKTSHAARLPSLSEGTTTTPQCATSASVRASCSGVVPSSSGESSPMTVRVAVRSRPRRRRRSSSSNGARSRTMSSGAFRVRASSSAWRSGGVPAEESHRRSRRCARPDGRARRRWDCCACRVMLERHCCGSLARRWRFGPIASAPVDGDGCVSRSDAAMLPP